VPRANLAAAKGSLAAEKATRRRVDEKRARDGQRIATCLPASG